MTWRKACPCLFTYKFRSTVKSQTKLATQEKENEKHQITLINQGWTTYTHRTQGNVGQLGWSEGRQAWMKSQRPRNRIQTTEGKVIGWLMRFLLSLSLSARRRVLELPEGSWPAIIIWISWWVTTGPREASFVTRCFREKVLGLGNQLCNPCLQTGHHKHWCFCAGARPLWNSQKNSFTGSSCIIHFSHRVLRTAEHAQYTRLTPFKKFHLELVLYAYKNCHTHCSLRFSHYLWPPINRLFPSIW